MAVEDNRDDVVPTSNEPSHEELASEEEIYLEETEEELRSELISVTPRTIVIFATLQTVFKPFLERTPIY